MFSTQGPDVLLRYNSKKERTVSGKVVDLSQYKHVDVTLSGHNVQYKPGPTGDVYQMSGDEYILLSPYIVFETGKDQTNMVWIKLNAVPTTYVLPFGQYNYVYNSIYISDPRDPTFKYRTLSATAQIPNSNMYILHDLKWHMVCWKLQNNNLSLFIDGVKNGLTVAIADSSMVYNVVGAGYSVGYWLNGDVGEYIIYNRALDNMEISNYYNHSKHEYGV